MSTVWPDDGKAANLFKTVYCKQLESKHNKYMYIQDTWNLTKFSVPIFYIPFISMTFPGLEMTVETISKYYNITWVSSRSNMQINKTPQMSTGYRFLNRIISHITSQKEEIISVRKVTNIPKEFACQRLETETEELKVYLFTDDAECVSEPFWTLSHSSQAGSPPMGTEEGHSSANKGQWLVTWTNTYKLFLFRIYTGKLSV